MNISKPQLIENEVDSGYICLVLILKLHKIPVSKDTLNKPIVEEKYSTIDILKNAKRIGLKAKATSTSYRRLKKLPTPSIIQSKEGTYYVLVKMDDENQILLFDANSNSSIRLSKDEFLDRWNNRIILFKMQNLIQEDSPSKFGLKWFLPFLYKYRIPLLEVVIASFLLNIFAIFTPLMVQVLIDKVLAHNGFSTLNVLAIALFVAAFFECLTNISRNYIFNNTGNKIDVILSSRLFKHMVRLPLRYFEVRRVGDTIARVKEIENIRRFLTGAPLTSILDVSFIFIYIILLFFYSSKLTYIVLGSLPLLIIMSAVITPILQKRLDEKFNKGAEAHSYLVETVSGMQTIKSFAVEEDFQNKWEHLQANFIKSSYKSQVLSGNASAIAQLIQKCTYLLVLWYGAQLVLSQEITVGQLIAFQMLSSRVSEPVMRLVQLWQDFQQAGISIKRLGDIFNTKEEGYLSNSKTRLPNIKGSIEFNRVNYRYQSGEAEVIRDMSFKIQPGTIVGVVGRSGSGKSTLSKLIQRLYLPEKGKVLIDGVDTTMIDVSWLRKQIGIVLQENYLFNGTIRDNICMNKPEASMEEVIRSARLAGAHNFILELTNGYDTMVGERGTALSGGQRQRIAIARAIITNPKILILDEATSALDYESETVIQRNLKNICKNRTVIIIAHRLSTLKDANRILVIDRGTLVEYDTQEKLLNKKGLFHHLYQLQKGGVEHEPGKKEN